jgi:acyl dehydratase
MKVSPLHTLSQGPVLATLARTILAAVTQKPTSTPPQTPGVERTEIVPPRPNRLVRDYIRHVGGDPGWYRGRLPFHLYPQWGFPLLSRCLADLPFDLLKVLNAGCGVTINRPLPAGEPLRLRARLERVDTSSERRVILFQSLQTGTNAYPDALVVEQRIIIPLAGSGGGEQQRTRKEKPRVPRGVHQVGRFNVRPGSGLEFAYLTGDFNPLHWLRPYARVAGHPRPIAHGFSTLARAIEVLNRNLWAGDAGRLQALDLRFTRPLHPPADVGVYIDDAGGLFVGAAPDGPVYISGSFTASLLTEG